MTRWNTTIRVIALAVVVLLIQACQRAEQTTSENQPAAVGAPPSASTQGAAKAPAPASSAPAARSEAKATTPAAPQPQRVTLPAGTSIKVRTTRTLSTKTLKTGDEFDAVLDAPLMAGDREAFPKGAMVMGKVVESDPGGRVKGVASMAIALTMLHTADGQMLMISTSPISVEAQSTKGKDAAKIAAGTAIGAAVGAIAGGGKGAGIGAATGAGAGTAVVLGTRGDAAEVPSETVLDFSLRDPLTFSR